MKIETFTATIKHDNGIIKLKVVSLNGKQGAIQKVIIAEGCPKCAIIDIVRINEDEV